MARKGGAGSVPEFASTDSRFEAELQQLYFDGIIAGKWWIPRSDESPVIGKHKGAIVAVQAWFEAGLCVPIHPFIRELMHIYGFDLMHLHPRSILRLNIFRWVCETVLHEPPSLPVFHYFFEVSIRPGKINSLGSLFGTVHVRFRTETRNGQPVCLKTSYPVCASPAKPDLWLDFKNRWFYLQISDPFYHNSKLKLSPYPALRKVVVKKMTTTEEEKVHKIVHARFKRSERDLLEEMFLGDCFKMKDYSTKLLGLCPAIVPPRRPTTVMTYEEAQKRAERLLGPYTVEEHRSCLADIGGFTKNNIVAERFNMKIPPRIAPSLGPQLVLSDGKTLGRLATCSREPVGSSKRNNVGAMPPKMITLGLKAADCHAPDAPRRKRKAVDAEPDVPKVHKAKKKKCEEVYPRDSPELEGDDLVLPKVVQQESVGRFMSGDLPLTRVSPASVHQKVEMDTWLQQSIMRGVLVDDNTDVTPLSPLRQPLLNDFHLDLGSGDEKDEASTQRKTCDPVAPSPAHASTDMMQTTQTDTLEWVENLAELDDTASGPSGVVRMVENLEKVARQVPSLKDKVRVLKRQGLRCKKSLEEAHADLAAKDQDREDLSTRVAQEQEKASLAERKLAEMERCLKEERVKMAVTEKELVMQQALAASVSKELVITSKQAEDLQKALDKEVARRALEELEASKSRVPAAHSLLSDTEAEVASRVHGCSQEIRSVLVSLKAKDLAPPSAAGSVLEACDHLSREVKMLGSTTRKYNRTMAAHTLALGVSAVLARGEGWESLLGKLTPATKTLYQKDMKQLLKASINFLVACDPDNTAGEGSNLAE